MANNKKDDLKSVLILYCKTLPILLIALIGGFRKAGDISLETAIKTLTLRSNSVAINYSVIVFYFCLFIITLIASDIFFKHRREKKAREEKGAGNKLGINDEK